MSNNYQVGVIGGGAWGTALAILANRAGSDVVFCTRNKNVIESIEERRTNDIHLPGVFVDPNIRLTQQMSQVCKSDVVVMAVPSHVLRSAVIALSDLIDANVPIVVATKGIERGSLMLMGEVVSSVLPKNPIAILSGPNFAEEAARGMPTATTLACRDPNIAQMLIYAIGGKLFRPYYTDDVISAQIGGSVKNVISIAAGIAHGKKLGDNARAALITRGFAEMTRLSMAKGGRVETMTGLAGLGDLVLTCCSTKSRNMSVGIALGQGKSIQEVFPAQSRMIVEGVATAESVVRMAQKLSISMPICEAVHAVLWEEAGVDQVIRGLLERPFAPEFDAAA